MKTKYILLVFLSLFMIENIDAQILKKLRKKAEQAAERTILKKTDEIVSKKTEKTIDDATTNKSKSKNKKNTNANTAVESTNLALKQNNKFKTDFYKEDFVLKIHENGNLNQIQHFDANAVAAKLNQDNNPKPGYIDSEGYMYAFKDGEYTKTKLVQLQSQGFMVPTMMLEAYKLPPEPFMAQYQKQTDLGVTANPFNGIIEFAFIYKPDDFRYEDFKETELSLKGNTYTRFEFINEAGYEGSYVLFDSQDRLIEIFTKVNESKQGFEIGEMPRKKGESLLVYNYKPVEVNLPTASEVRMKGQGLMEGVMTKVVKGGNQPKDEIDNDDYDTSDSKGMTNRVKKSIKNHKVTDEMLPESYDFDYIYKTTMVQNSKKSDAMDMNFLINTSNANYNGAEYILNNKKNQGSSIMIFDLDLMTMVMFMEYGNQKILQLYPIPEVKNTETTPNFTITELQSKNILGYKCIGLQLENDKYIVKAYHAKNAPIALSNFFGFSGSKGTKGPNLPDMDPKLLAQFEDSLVMEMQYEDKKRKKNNFTITAKSLDKKTIKIQKAGYKSMNMFSAGNMFKN